MNELELLRQMLSLREDGELPGGLIVAGKVYRKFSIGLDSGQNLKDIEQLNLRTEIERRCADFASRVEFPGLPKEALTYQAILNLAGPDLATVVAAAERLVVNYTTFRARGTEAKAEDGGANC